MVEQKRWEQIEELLQAALDLDPDARPAFLRAACDGDNDLRREIESLLARETEAERLDSPDILIANRCGDQTAMSLTGKRIGHYLIERRIGAGGMGVVYRAHDASLDRTVAIKVLPPELSANPARAERLDREARLASALNHPNIVTIHAVGDHAESKFIVSEYVDGRTLRQVLTDPTTGNGRPLDYDKCLDIAIQVASALTAAHTRWIIHRDIKPANIMLRDDGIVKVLDFGIAKLDEPATDPPADTGPLAGASPANPSSGSELTIPGAVIGTASYMSPEQARGEQLDGRTDLFSLGVVLYEMVTGRRLFEGATRAAATRALLRAKNPLPANVRIDSVAGPFEEVIRKCLQFRRDDRYASAAEMLEALELIKKQRAARKSRRMVLLIAGVLVVLALVASVGVAALLSVRYEWEERRLRDGHTAGVRKAALSPDGELLVSVGEDSRIIVWDFVRRTRLATLTDHSAWVVSVAFSPDGKWFVTGGYDRKAIVWDATHFKHAMTLEGHDGPVTGLAFSPDGRLLASASSEEPSDRTILWEVGLWKKIRELPTGAGDWGNILFSHDGNLLISKRYRTDHLWHSRTGQPVDEREASRLPLGTLRSFSPGNGVALSPNEKQAVVVESAGIVRFIDLTHPGANRRLQAHTDHVRAVAYSPDGKLLATGAEDIILWEPATQKVITHFVYPSAVWSVQFSLDARWLVSTHGDGSIVIWDMIERKRAANLNEHIESVRAVAISHDGKRAASASEDSSVIVWDIETGRKELVLLGHNTRVNALAWSPDGHWLASTDFVGNVILWDAQEGKRLRSIEKLYSTDAIAISPDGLLVATTHGVYDSGDGHEVVDFRDNTVPPWLRNLFFKFSSDGRRLIGMGSYLTIIDATTWQVLKCSDPINSNIVAMDLAPDERRLVTGDIDGSVRLWDVETLKETAILGRHAARVKSVAFSPDGAQVASAGDDKAIIIWDVHSRTEVARVGSHGTPVLAVAFSPDGNKIVSGEHDNSVHVYTRHGMLWGHRLD